MCKKKRGSQMRGKPTNDVWAGLGQPGGKILPNEKKVLNRDLVPPRIHQYEIALLKLVTQALLHHLIKSAALRVLIPSVRPNIRVNIARRGSDKSRTVDGLRTPDRSSDNS